ncbi:hypothetical protein, partial [Thiolapillus sp.]|uniref:hypothetical protein n=1 Tax=Thiolapillus sp. TaxID=2017437 RepID=UPI003AF953C3
RSEAYFVFPLAQGTPGKQCGLAATGVYQPSLRSPWLAAKEQEVRYRSKVLMAHFLGGRLVRVVWCEFKSESGHWKKAH